MSWTQKHKSERILNGLLFGQGIPLTLIVVIGLIVLLATGQMPALLDLNDHSMIGMVRGFMVNFLCGVLSLAMAVTLLKDKTTLTIALGIIAVVAELVLLIWYFFVRTGHDFLSYSPVNYLIGLTCIILQAVVVVYLLKSQRSKTS